MDSRRREAMHLVQRGGIAVNLDRVGELDGPTTRITLRGEEARQFLRAIAAHAVQAPVLPGESDEEWLRRVRGQE